MSPIENIVEDLKSLPPDKLELAADYIHRLKGLTAAERRTIIARTFASLSPEDAGEMERVIEEGCEKIDDQHW